MKLILAIIHDEDRNRVMDELSLQGYSVTKLCSTGGFLRSGNTTLLVGIDEDKIDNVLEIIEKNSKSRKQTMKSPVFQSGMESEFFPEPIDIIIGGAIVFVLNVERFEKI